MIFSFYFFNVQYALAMVKVSGDVDISVVYLSC